MTQDAAQLLDILRDDAVSDAFLPKTLFVLAHPDDESFGASVLVSRIPHATFVYVTNGAPRDGRDARLAGFDHPREYARARMREVKCALSLGSVPRAGVYFLNIVDQEAALELSSITRDIQSLIRQLNPEMVVTHPYEGGHPDHDSTAFAVHSACRLIERDTPGTAPQMVEMTSYHNRGGAFCFGEFLNPFATPAVEIALAPRQQVSKKQLLDCYPTQKNILRSARMDVERFRISPEYDFSQPPHPGHLLYEIMGWNMTGPRWRRLAAAAEEELGILRHVPPVNQHTGRMES
jgi:N-acetylglucosamine malate deacetylase 2